MTALNRFEKMISNKEMLRATLLFKLSSVKIIFTFYKTLYLSKFYLFQSVIDVISVKP